MISNAFLRHIKTNISDVPCSINMMLMEQNTNSR